MLVKANVAVTGDLANADASELEALSRRWAGVTGQRSLISWHYFLMLARLRGVKPDRMIRRFITKSIGRSAANDVGLQESIDLVTATADRLGVDVRALDHAIWRHQRGR